MEKLKSRNLNEKRVALQNHDDYRQKIANHRNNQIKYYEEMKRILVEFEELENVRLKFIKIIFEKVYEAQFTSLTGFKHLIEPLKTSIDKVDVVKDIQEFINLNKTKIKPDPLVDYEPYVSDYGIEVPAEKGLASDPNARANKSRTKSGFDLTIRKDKKNRSSKNNVVVSSPMNVEKIKIKFDSVDIDSIISERRVKSTVIKEEEKGDYKEKDKIKESDEDMQNTIKIDENKNQESIEDIKNSSKEAGNSSKEAKNSSKDELKIESSSFKSESNESNESNINKSNIAMALFDYTAADQTEINLFKGNWIIVTLHDGEIEDCPGWMEGRVKGKTGLFPSNYAKYIYDVKLSQAIFDFEAQEEEELSIQVGDLLIIQEIQLDWYFGFNEDGKSGLFPSTYVEIK